LFGEKVFKYFISNPSFNASLNSIFLIRSKNLKNQNSEF